MKKYKNKHQTVTREIKRREESNNESNEEQKWKLNTNTPKMASKKYK